MSDAASRVIGIGQTKYTKARDDVSIPGLVREAAQPRARRRRARLGRHRRAS